MQCQDRMKNKETNKYKEEEVSHLWLREVTQPFINICILKQNN